MLYIGGRDEDLGSERGFEINRSLCAAGSAPGKNAGAEPALFSCKYYFLSED